jgi:hypothetical protein
MAELAVQLFDWDSYFRQDAIAARPTSGHLWENCYAHLSTHAISAFCSAIATYAHISLANHACTLADFRVARDQPSLVEFRCDSTLEEHSIGSFCTFEFPSNRAR